MPKKKNPETQGQQSARFNAEVEKLIAAGELNPIEGVAALDKLLGKVGEDRNRARKGN